jgi:hypothetical protein
MYVDWKLLLQWRAFGMVKDDKGDVWLTTKEAATKLNLSVGRIYQIKNSLTHRKIGDTNQGRVFFLERTLFDDYMNM